MALTVKEERERRLELVELVRKEEEMKREEEEEEREDEEREVRGWTEREGVE